MKMKNKLITKILAFAGVIMMLFALAIPCFASEETSADDSNDAPYETFYAIFQTTDGTSKGIPLNQNKNTAYEDEFLSFNLNAGTTISEEYKYFQQSYDIQFAQAVDTIILRSGDFYLWKSLDYEDSIITDTLYIGAEVIPQCDTKEFEIIIDMVYNVVGMEDTVKSYVDTVYSDEGYIFLANAIDDDAYDSDAPLYIHSLEITMKFPQTDNLQVNIITTPKSCADLVNLPIDEDDEITFTDFSYLTSWIATATSGFLDAEILPGITFGGILTVIIAFSVVLMLLKMFR